MVNLEKIIRYLDNEAILYKTIVYLESLYKINKKVLVLLVIFYNTPDF